MKKSFTLIEVLIYLSIVSGVLVFLLVSGFNLINYQERIFYYSELNKEISFINKKILFYLNGSSDFIINTSSTSTQLRILYPDNETSIILKDGIFYKNELIPLTSSHFDFSSTIFEILTGSKKGIKIIFRAQAREKPQTKSELEFIFYQK